MKINVPVRFKNVYFWVAVGAAILAAIGISPEMLTDWSLVGEAIVNMLRNPYQLGCVIFAIIGVFNDPTTNGLGDSNRAMTYKKPYKE